MIGRSKNWSGPSDFIQEFNKKHNPEFYYGKNTEKKKTPKKKTDRKRDTTKRYPVFKVQD
jgi:hypothetical protein